MDPPKLAPGVPWCLRVGPEIACNVVAASGIGTSRAPQNLHANRSNNFW